MTDGTQTLMATSLAADYTGASLHNLTASLAARTALVQSFTADLTAGDCEAFERLDAQVQHQMDLMINQLVLSLSQVS